MGFAGLGWPQGEARGGGGTREARGGGTRGVRGRGVGRAWEGREKRYGKGGATRRTKVVRINAPNSIPLLSHPHTHILAKRTMGLPDTKPTVLLVSLVLLVLWLHEGKR